MRTEADLTALCNEFTNALTEVLAENAVGLARRGRSCEGTCCGQKSILNTMNMHFAWRWRRRSLSGKRCRTSVTNTDPISEISSSVQRAYFCSFSKCALISRRNIPPLGGSNPLAQPKRVESILLDELADMAEFKR